MSNPLAPTPAPWTVDECEDADGFWTIRPADGSANGDTNEQPIATVYESEHASLIAAAPAMKEALEKAESVLSLIETSVRVGMTRKGWEIVDAARDAARSALAAATGGKS